MEQVDIGGYATQIPINDVSGATGSSSNSYSTARRNTMGSMPSDSLTVSQAKVASGEKQGVRELTLKQLRDLIASICDSKEKHDKNCNEMRVAHETMEQHMYTYLQKRFGLQSKVLEYASAIIGGIRTHASREVDINAFGKIMQNSLAESFPRVQRTLAETVERLVRQEIGKKFPGADEQKIADFYRQRAEGRIPVEECEAVVLFMYNSQDAQDALSRVRRLSSGRDDACYNQFVQVLLGFQIQLTEKFLEEFGRTFRAVDEDGDGILDSMQLRELIDRIAPNLSEQEIENHRSLVDTYDLGQATFTQCVHGLTTLIDKSGKR